MPRLTALFTALTLALTPTFAEAQRAQFSLSLSARLEVRNPETQRELPALPLVEERLRVVVDGQHATTSLRQVFHNQTPARLEGRYALRPTMDARVHGFAYYIGEERIVGEVLERQAARRVYTEVTTQRRDPAILEQTADGEFTFRVFPIEPSEDKRVELEWGEWLRRRGSTVEYRAPLGANGVAEVIVRDARARDLRSTTHHVDVEPIEGGLRVRTRARAEAGDELLLRWTIAEPAWTPSAWVHRDEGQDGYFLVSLAAPAGFEDRVSAKDVTLVLDRSGSMTGQAIVNARAAAMDVIGRLEARDRLNVIAFDDDVDPLFASPRAADAEVRADALTFVDRLRPGGGTDIAFALSRALSAQHDDRDRPQVVIFLTDGQSSPDAALRVAERAGQDVRVFTVGLGADVNRALLTRLAATRRGSFTAIDRAERIESEVGHLYAQIARPLLVDVRLEIEGGVASRVYPRTISDLFVDDELVLSGRYRGRGPVGFVVRGTLGGRAVSYRARASARATGPRTWVGRHWASQRIDHLLEQIQLEGERAELRDEVVSLALAYDVVTPYTAFLAIPEREVTAGAAQELANARAQRAAAARRHQDASALRGQATSGGSAAPRGAPDADEADWESDGVEEELSRSAGPSMPAPTSYGGAGSAAGCASCNVGEGRPMPRSGLGLLAALALALGVRRRRR